MNRTVRAVAVAWALALGLAISLSDGVVQTQTTTITEAPTGFDGGTNGFLAEFCANQGNLVDSPNSPMIPDDECNADAATEEFTGPETPGDGLGPIFNHDGCGSCHFTPILGGGSQITEKRAGRFDGTNFFEHPGGSLIQDRVTALEPEDRHRVLAFQERVLPGHNVLAFRATISLFGDGFVEAVGNSTLQGIANNQPSAQRGQLISVPVLERPGTTRFGRFGWKGQQASLVSFSADAYVNEMGITSPLQPDEPTANGASVEQFDFPGVDDPGVDVELFALFQRDLKAPPRDAALAATPDAQAGSTLFSSIGCATCHTPSVVTSSPGTLINGGAMRVTRALGNKRIRPFGDFLLHDIGTGDGIVQNGGASTRNKVRTAPLWGLRVRGRLMHDAASLSIEDAINRHRNQANDARLAFLSLSSTNRARLLAFLNSL